MAPLIVGNFTMHGRKLYIILSILQSACVMVKAIGHQGQWAAISHNLLTQLLTGLLLSIVFTRWALEHTIVSYWR